MTANTRSLEERCRAQAKLHGPERGAEWHAAQTQDILNEAAAVVATKDKLLVEAREALGESWALLQTAYRAHQKMSLEGQGNRGLSHEMRMFAQDFSMAETPKTPEHTILSGNGRYWKWREFTRTTLANLKAEMEGT